MTYETSQNQATGEPVELFSFLGLGTTYRFTSAAEPLVYNTYTYLADTPISSSNRGINPSDLLKNGIDVNMPSNHPLVLAAIQQVPGDPIQLTVFRGYQPDFVVYWKGAVLSVEVDGPEATLRCLPLVRSLDRKSLRLRVMHNCNHVLYDTQCLAVRTDFEATGTIDSIPSAFSLTSSTFAIQPDQYYRGGAIHIFATPQGTFKTLILDHVGNTIKVQANLVNVSAGLNFTAALGCDHLIGTCHTKFSNKANFGGYPSIPTKNPFVGDAIV